MQTDHVVLYQEQSQTSTLCSPAFLAEIRTHGEIINFNIQEIARKVRAYIDDNPQIPVETVYYEVATFALRGRRPRTVRYWVEALAGFSDRSLEGWGAAGLSMDHYTAARKLYRDGYVDSPSQALDAAINHREQEDRPLTVDQMESLYEPRRTEFEDFMIWLRGVLDRDPPSSWSRSQEFKDWLKAGEVFYKNS